MTLTQSQLNESIAIAHEKINDEIASGFAEANYFYSVMFKKPNLRYSDGGRSITIPIEAFENDNMGFFNGKYDTIPTNSQQQISHASFDWRFFVSSTSFNLAEFATGTGALSVIDLIEAKVNLTKNKAVRDLSKALHTLSSTDPNQINSLKDVVADAAYGGISSTDVPSWAAIRNSTQNDITYAGINSTFQELAARGQMASDDVGSYSPNLMLSNAYVQSVFLASQQSQQQFQSDSALKSGFNGILFNNVQWQIDQYCTGSASASVADNELYILATPTFRLFYRHGFEGRRSPLDTLNMRLPNQAVVSSQTYMTMNLCNIARRYNAVFTALQS